MNAIQRTSTALVTLAICVGPPSARAQPVDRTIGEEQFGGSLQLTALTGPELAKLAVAAGVPMGFEAAGQPTRFSHPVTATGRKLIAVLDDLIRADDRYEWREDDGVIVVRPPASWRDPLSVFNTAVGPIRRREMQASDAAALMAHLFGVRSDLSSGPGDTIKFAVDLPDGGTLLAVLNAIVRAHGTMTWSLAPTSVGATDQFPMAIMVFVGSSGKGAGIPRDAGIATTLRVEQTTTAEQVGSLLDMVIGTKRDGTPLLIRSVFQLKELAAAVRVPMGIEALSGSAVFVPSDGVRVTGLTLRDALQVLTTIDPRYAWREMDGVIVLRPMDAWNDGASPLFRIVSDLRAENVTVERAIGVLMARLGDDEHVKNFFPDTRRMSLDLPQGSVLDGLNHLARAHGELCWEWRQNSAEDRRFYSGRRFMLTFWLFNGNGYGFAIP
jgi:hypothetical protein